jgi:hypothetical protein
MKILTILLLVFTTFTQVRSQILISILLGDKLNSDKIEFGLDGGVNYPDMRGVEEGEMKPNFNLGFYFDIKTKNPKWLFHTGVLVKSTLGTAGLPVYSLNNADLDNAFVGGQVQRKINYFNVPIGMKYKFNPRFFALGAMVPSLRNKAHDIFTTEFGKDDLEFKRDINSELHRLDFGVMGGLGYRLMGGNGMNLTLSYYYGLVDIVIKDTTPEQYNTSLYLSVGIPIGAGKAKEKE